MYKYNSSNFVRRHAEVNWTVHAEDGNAVWGWKMRDERRIIHVGTVGWRKWRRNASCPRPIVTFTITQLYQRLHSRNAGRGGVTSIRSVNWWESNETEKNRRKIIKQKSWKYVQGRQISMTKKLQRADMGGFVLSYRILRTVFIIGYTMCARECQWNGNVFHE